MRYERMEEAVFESRPNRFIAHVRRGGETLVCHVKNTGRCREQPFIYRKVTIRRGKPPMI